MYQIRTYVMFHPWTHTSDDSYIYQLSLVVATATVSLILRPTRSLYFRPRGHLGRPCEPHQRVQKWSKILMHAERGGATPRPTPGNVNSTLYLLTLDHESIPRVCCNSALVNDVGVLFPSVHLFLWGGTAGRGSHHIETPMVHPGQCFHSRFILKLQSLWCKKQN